MAEGPTAEPSKESGMTFGVEFRQQWVLILVLFLMQVFAFGFPTFALPFVYAGATDEFGWTRQQAVLLASFIDGTVDGKGLLANGHGHFKLRYLVRSLAGVVCSFPQWESS